MAMNQSSQVDQAREARADNETLEEHSRTRKLTEKVWSIMLIRRQGI